MLFNIPNNRPMAVTTMTRLDYGHAPYLTQSLSDRSKRAVKRHFLTTHSTRNTGCHGVFGVPVLPPIVANNNIRGALGAQALNLPLIPKKSDAMVTLRQDVHTQHFHYDSNHVKVIMGPTIVNSWDYSTYSAQMDCPGGHLDIELREMTADPDVTPAESAGQYQRLVQQDYYAATLLELFKNKMKRHAPHLTVPEANLVAMTRFVKSHVLCRRDANTRNDKTYLLQAPINVLHLRTATSTTSFEPPEHEGNSPMEDFLYAFTHFTYEHHNRRALLYGFQATENTIYSSVLLDRDFKWHAERSSTPLKYFAEEHECHSLCKRLGLKAPVLPCINGLHIQ
ncbi:uncharacterized protein MELLADRAFT_86492 [Melampsora larici-populina 98AG31]|uniref:Alpha-type protein kinase domain-containing protein n=1 Tax=Melampsora larici-populina (strain 98AG31 / pathotype 3-4-7) TaxID=747676 RepID=F4RM13_MELLP|nr:uncharacterized protein MELLADRAFT_86492 [Melampsora larici-populina 98AG31]EGG06643.1 hypothetical protein MELLADRAFT_86492 [Melampsora larici-populina 98AG31]